MSSSWVLPQRRSNKSRQSAASARKAASQRATLNAAVAPALPSSLALELALGCCAIRALKASRSDELGTNSSVEKTVMRRLKNFSYARTQFASTCENSGSPCKRASLVAGTRISAKTAYVFIRITDTADAPDRPTAIYRGKLGLRLT